jgi:hypothetical protein
VSPVRYGLDFYIPEDAILHSHRCDILNSYITLLIQEKTENNERNSKGKVER